MKLAEKLNRNNNRIALVYVEFFRYSFPRQKGVCFFYVYFFFKLNGGKIDQPRNRPSVTCEYVHSV